MQLSRFFTLAELTRSETAAREGIANQPGASETAALRELCAAVLDPLRDAIGAPIKVNSGYRGPVLNRRIGGAATSQHLLGQAADIQSPGTAVLELFKRVIRLGLPFDQIIYEAQNATTKWVHVSHRPGANRGEIRVARFGPNGRPTGYPLVSAQQALAMSEPATRSRAAAEPRYVEVADEPMPDEEAVPAAKSDIPKPAAVKRKAAPAPALPTKRGAGKKVAAKKGAPKKESAKEAAAPRSKGAAARKAEPARKAPAAKGTAARKAPAATRTRGARSG